MSRKAPAFQFYVDDWIAGTFGMTACQKGIYIDLLALQWSRGRISESELRVLRAVEGSEAVESVLASKFSRCQDHGWVNRRLEHVRQISETFKQNGSKGGSKTQADRKAKRVAKRQAKDQAEFNSPSPSPSPSPSLSPTPQECCSEMGTSSDPNSAEGEEKIFEFPEFPTVRGRSGDATSWLATDDLLKRLGDGYPGVNVRSQARRAHSWILANPRKQKTAGGMENFLFRWMANEQNRSSGSGGQNNSQKDINPRD